MQVNLIFFKKKIISQTMGMRPEHSKFKPREIIRHKKKSTKSSLFCPFSAQFGPLGADKRDPGAVAERVGVRSRCLGQLTCVTK